MQLPFLNYYHKLLSGFLIIGAATKWQSKSKSILLGDVPFCFAFLLPTQSPQVLNGVQGAFSLSHSPFFAESRRVGFSVELPPARFFSVVCSSQIYHLAIEGWRHRNWIDLRKCSSVMRSWLRSAPLRRRHLGIVGRPEATGRGD